MQVTFPARPTFAAAALLLAASLGVIIAAMLFEHVGGYRPCELCYLERKPWYFAAPASLLAVLALRLGREAPARLLLGILALLFVLNAGLAGYHAGIEWNWWAGPSSCTGSGAAPLGGGPGGLLASLETIRIVPCDVAQFRLFGLSFAGYNFFMSLGVALIALAGALYGRRSGQP